MHARKNLSQRAGQKKIGTEHQVNLHGIRKISGRLSKKSARRTNLTVTEKSAEIRTADNFPKNQLSKSCRTLLFSR